MKPDIAVGRIEFMGEIVGGTIIYGEPGIEPIFGVDGIGIRWNRLRS